MEQARIEKLVAQIEATTVDRFNINDQWSEREGARIVEGFLELQASDYLTGPERWEN